MGSADARKLTLDKPQDADTQPISVELRFLEETARRMDGNKSQGGVPGGFPN